MREGNATEARGRSAFAVYIGFVLTGVVTTLLDPLLPFLSSSWRLSDERAGYFFTAQFAGSIVGVLLTSGLLPRAGYRTTLLLGYVLMALGTGTLGLGSWTAGILSVLCFGVGLGLTIPASNLLISALNPAGRASALSILNFAWGIGAVACPFAVRLTPQMLEFTIGVAAASALIAALIASTGAMAAPGGPSKAPGCNISRNRLVPVLALLFFLYVGTETSLGGWSAAYARRMGHARGAGWVLAPAFFWGGLLLGRALAPLALRRFSDRRVALVGLALAAAGTVVLLFAAHINLIFVGMSLAGLGLASVFPITVALLARFGSASTQVAGPMFAMAGVGGAVIPWLVGFFSTQFGGLKTGLEIPLATILLLILLHSTTGESPAAAVVSH